jgi:lysozyme
MTAPQSLREQLLRDEGTVLVAYADSEGYMTIGTGRLIDKRKGGGITQDESDYLLDNDINRVQTQVLARWPWVAGLSEPRRGAMLAMAFQMGTAGLATFVNTLRLVKAGQYQGAANSILKSKWAGQTPTRAHRLARQMEIDVWQ